MASRTLVSAWIVGDEVVSLVLALEIDELPQCAEIVADVQRRPRAGFPTKCA